MNRQFFILIVVITTLIVHSCDNSSESENVISTREQIDVPPSLQSEKNTKTVIRLNEKEIAELIKTIQKQGVPAVRNIAPKGIHINKK